MKSKQNRIKAQMYCSWLALLVWSVCVCEWVIDTRGAHCLPTLRLEMHPGKEASSLHAHDRDEDVGGKDEEDDDGYQVVHAV